MNSINETIKSFYLEYLNDFLTVECYASYKGLSVEHATKLLSIGRELCYE